MISTFPRAGLIAALLIILTVSCGGGGDDGKEDESSQDNPSIPSLIFSADQIIVDSGSNVTLSWTAENVSSCLATGDWSGNKNVSDNEVVGPLTENSEFVLDCEGSAGFVSRTANVLVNTSSSLTVEFTVDDNSVLSGSSVTLEWDAPGATGCVASGAWTGNKSSSGSEAVGPLTANSTFFISCSDASSTLNKSVSVAVVSVSSDGVSGFIDSSYIEDRLGINQVYIYSGNVTPDDRDGDSGDPIMVVDVEQAAGTCNFSYSAGGLVNGDYTIAYTAEGGNDISNQDDNINFTAVSNFSFSGSPVQHDMSADNILRVGPSRTFKTVQSAVASANSGDVIEVDAGLYEDDIVVFRTDNLTVRGVGAGRAHIRGTYVIPFVSGSDIDNGMGLWVVKANNLTVENIEFSNARVDDENGAGIRNQGSDLTICNSYFHNNEDGFLGGAFGTLLIEFSEFYLNGWTDLGRNHNMYIDIGDKFILRHSYSHHAKIGHNVKTRARENYILYNRIMDEADGTASYAIDVPNGGLTYVIGNLIQQGPDTDNSTIFPYGAEGLSGDGRTHKLYIINNTLVNDRGSGSFLSVSGGAEDVKIINNIFTGGGGGTGSAVGTVINNLVSDDPGLVNRSNYDYRLQSDATARNAGTDPGTGEGMDLMPVYQYVHPISRELRPLDGTVDIGAYEFN